MGQALDGTVMNEIMITLTFGPQLKNADSTAQLSRRSLKMSTVLTAQLGDV